MDIKIELKGIEKALKTYSPKVVQNATRSALNKTIKKAGTVASREIRQSYNIKKKELDKRTMKIIRARVSNLTAEIYVMGRPLSLAKFGARQTKQGVTLKTKKGGRRILKRHHFLATMKSGHRGVYKQLRKTPLPIAEPRMISVHSMFGGKKVMPKVERTINENWERVFTHELKYYMDKA